MSVTLAAIFLKALFGPAMMFLLLAPGYVVRYALWRWLPRGFLRKILLKCIDRNSWRRQWQPPSKFR